MKQRLGLGLTILQKPELLILDEPTNGMDPAGMRDIRNLIIALSEQRTTIFLSSHLLYEVEQICDRVAVLKGGKIVAEGGVQNLRGSVITVKVRVPAPNLAANCLQTLPGITAIKSNGSSLIISGVSSQEIIALLTSNNIIPSEVTLGGTDLESIFLEMTEGAQEETRGCFGIF